MSGGRATFNRLHVASCSSVALFALALDAQAQAPPVDASPSGVAAAEDAFRRGMESYSAEDYETACPLLLESLQLDYGMATEFRLAECYEAQGKTYSAYQRFVAVAERAAGDGLKDREKVARDRASSLEPKLMQLAVRLPEDVQGAAVTLFRGAEQLDIDTDAPVRLDPGSYRVVVNAPDRPAFEEVVELSRSGETLVVQVVLAPKSDAEPATTEPTPSPEEGGGMSTLSAVGLAIAGVGVVGLGVGTALGFVAKSDYDESEPFCSELGCTDEGLTIRDDARSLGTTATVVFIVGGVLTAGGVVLWLTAPEDSPSTQVGVTPGGLSVRHAF